MSFLSCIGDSDYNVSSSLYGVWTIKIESIGSKYSPHHAKGIEAADAKDMYCTCDTQWYIIGVLLIIMLGRIYLVTNKIKKVVFV